MLAILSLLSVKDYVYIGAILVLLGAFSWYTAHEREAGAKKVEVAVAAKAASVAKDNLAITTAAQAASTAVGVKYETLIVAPPVPSLKLVCNKASPSGSTVPTPPANTASVAPTVASRSAASFDPSGPALTVGRAADAKIAGLQAEVAVLQKAMREAATRK